MYKPVSVPYTLSVVVLDTVISPYMTKSHADLRNNSLSLSTFKNSNATIRPIYSLSISTGGAFGVLLQKRTI